MMKSIKIKTYLIGLSAVGAMLLSGCLSANALSMNNSTSKLKKNVDGSVIYPHKDGKYTAYDYVPAKSGYNYGTKPTKSEMKAWNVQVIADKFEIPGKPGSTNLPVGHGSVGQGETIYSNQCAVCHGDFGMGGLGYPTLSGGIGTLKNQMLNATDSPPLKTVGSYWPYASTLFYYIRKSMPFPHPKSLSNDQVYALVAYLLSVNNITIDGKNLGYSYVLNRKKFLEIKMPNANGFYPNVDKPGAASRLKAFLSNPNNWGKGNTCMHNCLKGTGDKVVKIKQALTDFSPPFSNKYDLPKVKGAKKVSFAEKVYKNTCDVCHGNDNMGAPMFGDKAAWAKIIKQGMKKVYSNAIHGIGGMPPKGGTNLSDSQFKTVVDYLVNSGK